jgi:orotidine-5'-phosphate decarboxylase
MPTSTAPAPAEVRARLAVALDVDDAVLALRLGRELSPWIGVAKVGLELYTAAGPDIVGGLHDLGLDVFCDLKLHDIPTTVGKAARVVGSLGARYLNFHAQGGVAMLTAGVDGFLAARRTRASARPPRSRSRSSRATVMHRRTSSASACRPRSKPGAEASCARRPTCTR